MVSVTYDYLPPVTFHLLAIVLLPVTVQLLTAFQLFVPIHLRGYSPNDHSSLDVCSAFSDCSSSSGHSTSGDRLASNGHSTFSFHSPNDCSSLGDRSTSSDRSTFDNIVASNGCSTLLGKGSSTCSASLSLFELTWASGCDLAMEFQAQKLCQINEENNRLVSEVSSLQQSLQSAEQKHHSAAAEILSLKEQLSMMEENRMAMEDRCTAKTSELQAVAEDYRNAMCELQVRVFSLALNPKYSGQLLKNELLQMAGERENLFENIKNLNTRLQYFEQLVCMKDKEQKEFSVAYEEVSEEHQQLKLAAIKLDGQGSRIPFHSRIRSELSDHSQLSTLILIRDFNMPLRDTPSCTIGGSTIANHLEASWSLRWVQGFKGVEGLQCTHAKVFENIWILLSPTKEYARMRAGRSIYHQVKPSPFKAAVFLHCTCSRLTKPVISSSSCGVSYLRLLTCGSATISNGLENSGQIALLLQANLFTAIAIFTFVKRFLSPNGLHNIPSCLGVSISFSLFTLNLSQGFSLQNGRDLNKGFVFRNTSLANPN
eukprot:Gb_03087 [translate_table: standard]